MRIIEPSYEIITTINPSEVMRHIELCGRVCYKSEDKMTDTSAEKMIKMLINSGHESVLEHFSFTVRFTNDRSFSHEIVRHRLASFSQESQRYCAYNKDKFENSVTMIDVSESIKNDNTMKKLSVGQIAVIYDIWEDACLYAEKSYFNMLEAGASPQIARKVLPNSTKTELYITANLREWRTILKLRTPKTVDPSMRTVMPDLLKELQEILPAIFGDITISE